MATKDGNHLAARSPRVRRVEASKNVVLYRGMERQTSLAAYTDGQLIEEVNRLASSERRATAALVAALAEFDTRRLYLPLGFSSLFAYCVQRLRLSEDATCNRIEAARAARRYPEILALLETGELSLTAARLLAPHLNDDNHNRVLADARHKKRSDIDLLIAKLHPQPPVASIVRKLPEAKAPAQVPGLSLDAPAGVPHTAPPSRRPIVAPLSEAHYKLQVTISAASRERLKHIQDLMRHTIPNGDPAAIVERALELLHDDLLKKKAAGVARPRSTARAAGPAGRHIPSSVKREVWRRDQGRCAFVSPDGHRCDNEGFVEYHHVDAYWLGGDATAVNIELRCRAHNGFEWQRQQDKMLDATV